MTRQSLLLLLVIGLIVTALESRATLAQDLKWGKVPGNYVQYQVRIDETTKSSNRDHAGKRTVELDLAVRMENVKDGVAPMLVKVARYAVSEKNEADFRLQFDTSRPADEDAAFVHETAVELCQRLYPVGVDANVSIGRFGEYSVATQKSAVAAEQFDRDLQVALAAILPALDGGNTSPRTWTTAEEWAELRDPVPLKIEHRLVSIVEHDPKLTKGPAGGKIGKVTYQGKGQATQTGLNPYQAELTVDGSYQFEFWKIFRGGAVVSARRTETLKTDDAYKSGLVRRTQVTFVSGRPDRKPDREELEFYRGGNNKRFTLFNKRPLLPSENKR